MNITLEQAKKIDEILSHQIHLQQTNGSDQFNKYNILEFLNEDYELTDFIFNIITSTTINHIPIVTTKDHPNGYYSINKHTSKFINDGGFVSIYYEEVEEENKKESKEKLELENLKLGPKQHRFNKISVWINAILTTITIILTVLIALGIIGIKD